MPSDVGTAFVDIRPDLSGFMGRLTAGVMGIVPGVERGVSGALSRSMRTAAAVAAGALGVGVLAGAVREIAVVGIEYDKAMSLFRATTQATAADMARAAATAARLGNDMNLPGVSAAGAAAAMTELAKAGLTTQQSIDAARGALQLSIAAQTSEAEAATITANALLTFGLAARESTRVTDLLAGAANSSSASMTDIAYGLQMAGAAMKGAKVPIEDTMISLTMLANAGIRGSDAGTLMKTAITRLTAPTGKAATLMKTLGLRMYDSKGNFVGIRDAIAQLQAKLGPLGQQQRAAAVNTIFGADAMRFANIAIDQGVTAWDRYAKNVTRSGQAADLAKAQNTGLGGALDNLQSTAETVGLALYTKISPGLTDMVKGITAGITALPGLVTKFRDFITEASNSPVVRKALDLLRPAFDNVREAISPLLATGRNLWTLLKELWPVIQPVAAALGVALLLAFRAVTSALSPLATVLEKVTGFLVDHKDAVFAVAAGVAAFTAVLYAQKAITLGVALAQRAWAAAMLLARGAVLSAQVAVWLLNTALLANPIGLIIAAIIGLVVGLVVLYKKNAAFRALVQKVWAAIKTAIKAAVDWIVNTAVPWLANAWNWIVDGAKALWQGLVDAWNAIKSAVSTGINAVIGFITKWGTFLIAWGLKIINIITMPQRIAIALVLAIWGWLAKTVGGFLVSLGQRILTGFQRIYHFIVDPIVAAAQWVWSILQRIHAAFVAAFTRVATAVIGFVTRFTAPIVSALTWLWGRITAAWAAIRSAISSALSRIIGIVSAGWNRVRTAVANAINLIRTTVSRVWNGIVSLVSSVGGRIVSAVSGAWNRVVATITGFTSRAASAASGVGRSILNAITGFASDIYSAGTDIVQGLIDGILSMGSRLYDAVMGFIKRNVPAPALKALGIASPSKVFAEIGKFTAKGFIQGLTGTEAQVRAAIQRMASLITKAFAGQKTAKDDNLIKWLRRQGDALIRLARQRTEVAKRLTAAQATLTELQKKATDLNASLRENLRGGIVLDGVRNADQIVGYLQRRLTAVQTFQANLAALTRKGVSQDIIEQIANAGLEQGGATAAALANASAAQIAQVNNLQGQLTSTSNTAANSITGSLYNAGIQAAQGLVKGLQSQQAAITAQMTTIANAMAKAIKRALGIRSPSKVMRGLGVHTGHGLALGLLDKKADITAASRSLARATVNGYQPGGFASNSLTAPTNQQTIRVFIGDRELTDIVRVEVDGAQTNQARQMAYGRRV